MLFQMALVLAIVGTLTEVLIVHKIKYVDKLYTKGSHLFWVKSWHVDGVIWNSVGSFALSYAQGKMFGATGLVIALSGALSTGISMGYFELEKWIQKTYNVPTILAFFKIYQVQIKKTMADALQLALDVWRAFVWFLKVITFPIRVIRGGKAKWNNFKLQYLSLPTTKGASG